MYSLTARRVQSGFTLVELVLVVTIMALMSGAIIPSFTSYLRGQSLKQAEEKFKSDIRTIQNKALTGSLSDRTITISGTPRAITHWGIRFNANNATYTYFIAAVGSFSTYANECTNFSAGGRSQGTASFPSDMVYRSGTGCLFFDIKSATPRVQAISGSFVSPFRFGYTASTTAGSCRGVYMNTAGLIYTTTAAIACP